MNKKTERFFSDFPFLTEVQKKLDGKTLLEENGFEDFLDPDVNTRHLEVRVSRFSPELMLIAPTDGCFGETDWDGDFYNWTESENYYLLDNSGKVIDSVLSSWPYGPKEGERVGDVVKRHQDVAYIVSLCCSDEICPGVTEHKLTVYKR